jgi:hypothetical protein
MNERENTEAVVKEYVVRLEAIRAELQKTESWGDHLIVTSTDFTSGRLEGGIFMSVKCSRCGIWTTGTEHRTTRRGYVEAARRLVQVFQGYYPDNCRDARRLQIVRDVMES